MKIRQFLLFAFALTLLACGQPADVSTGSNTEGESGRAANSYVVLNEDLQQLKDDFNANEGRVRLMFLSGPTCGICLRGMADLNDAFLAASQNDDRLVTFVVHVPALGAKEEHVADTIPLLDGPRVHHYWEDSGIIGRLYSDVMEVRMYVWDFWAIYGPDARWDETLPPKPDYYEHQLGVSRGKSVGFPRERVLNAERFAEITATYIDQVDSTRFAEELEPEQSEMELLADGTSIPVVAQPRNVAVSQHIRMRGGYKNLKSIQAMEKRGQLQANGREFPLSISTARPNNIQRKLSVGDRVSLAELSESGEVLLDSSDSRGLPSALESQLLRTFEFDGLLVEWPDKGHEVSMVGMLKIGDVLAWKLDFQQKDGPHWNLFIDSRGGGLVQADLLDENGDPEYVIRQSDFRETSGFSLPYRVEYFDAAGQSIAVEVLDEINVEKQAFDVADEDLSH
jgi:hypothetical protein